MKSWKTTVAGLAMALGMALLAIHSKTAGAPMWMFMVGTGLTVFAPALLGMAARDNGVSSEDAGAK